MIYFFHKYDLRKPFFFAFCHVRNKFRTDRNKVRMKLQIYGKNQIILLALKFSRYNVQIRVVCKISLGIPKYTTSNICSAIYIHLVVASFNKQFRMSEHFFELSIKFLADFFVISCLSRVEEIIRFILLKMLIFLQYYPILFGNLH